MDFDENNGIEQQEEDAVEIYSRMAIFWFSVLASPLIGGVLLVLNLKEAGLKKAMYSVLLFTIIYTIVTQLSVVEFLAINKLDKIDTTTPNKNFLIVSSISLGLNIIGGLILSQYFFKKYFPDDDYYPKSVLSPLFIVIILIFLLRYIGFGGI